MLFWLILGGLWVVWSFLFGWWLCAGIARHQQSPVNPDHEPQ